MRTKKLDCFYKQVLVLTLLGCSYLLQGQTYIGLQGGVHQSNSLVFFTRDNSSLLVAPNANYTPTILLSGEFPINTKLWLCISPTFQIEGTQLTHTGQGTDATYYTTNTLGYLHFPLALKMKLALQKNTFYGKLGWTTAYLMYGRYTEWQSIRTKTTAVVDLAKEQLERWDFGPQFAIGFEKEIANRHLINIELNYAFGLNNIYTDAMESFNEGLNILIGLSHPIIQK